MGIQWEILMDYRSCGYHGDEHWHRTARYFRVGEMHRALHVAWPQMLKRIT